MIGSVQVCEMPLCLYLLSVKESVFLYLCGFVCLCFFVCFLVCVCVHRYACVCVLTLCVRQYLLIPTRRSTDMIKERITDIDKEGKK
jgi:hypothetical protein